MTLKENDFSAGSTVGDGNAITTANSDDSGQAAFSVASFPGTGGSGLYDDDDTPTGLGWSGSLQSISGSSPTIVALSDTSSNSFTCRWYMKIPGNPGASGSLGVRSQTSVAGQGAKGYIDTAGKLQIVGGFGTTTSTGTSVPLNSWVRFEFTCSGNGTTASCLVSPDCNQRRLFKPLV